MFEKHKLDKILIINMICVDPQASGKGISIQMLRWTEQITLKSNIQLMSGETTGIASAKIFEKCGFSSVKEILYNDYTTQNDEKPLKNLDPHKSCIIWEKKVSSSINSTDSMEQITNELSKM